MTESGDPVLPPLQRSRLVGDTIQAILRGMYVLEVHLRHKILLLASVLLGGFVAVQTEQIGIGPMSKTEALQQLHRKLAL